MTPTDIDLRGNNLQNVGAIENVPADIIRYIYGENDNGELVKEGCDDLCMGNTGGNGGVVGPSEGGSALPPGSQNQTLRHNGESWEATNMLKVFHQESYGVNNSNHSVHTVALNGDETQMEILNFGVNLMQGNQYRPCLRLIRTFQGLPPM